MYQPYVAYFLAFNHKLNSNTLLLLFIFVNLIHMYLLKKVYEIESNPVIDEVKYYTKRGCIPIHTAIKILQQYPMILHNKCIL